MKSERKGMEEEGRRGYRGEREGSKSTRNEMEERRREEKTTPVIVRAKKSEMHA